MLSAFPTVNQGKTVSRSRPPRRMRRIKTVSGGHLQRNHGAAFEAENPSAGAEIVAPYSAVRKHRKIAATILDAVCAATQKTI